MKIQFMSDLHLEYADNVEFLSRLPHAVTGDVLVLAGDILYLGDDRMQESSFLKWAADNFEQVLITPGNHEYYGGRDMHATGDSWEYKLAPNVGYYNNKVVTIGDTDFIMSTLWTHIPAARRRIMGYYLNDFHRIRYDGGDYSPADYNAEHARSLDFIKQAVAGSTAPRRVVVTHHVPTLLCSPPKFKGGKFESAIVADLTEYIRRAPIDYWIYGHSHINLVANIGGTRVVSNQLGYVFRGENEWNRFDFSRHI